MIDPKAFPLLPQAVILASHGFNYQDAEVPKGVAGTIKMGCHWLLYPPVCNVIAMAIHADMNGILCFSHILLLAFLALD